MTTETRTRFDLDAAPLAVRDVTLLVDDLDRMAEFYSRAIGLRVHAQTADSFTLGASRPVLTLRAPGGLAPRDPSAPGLFHTAFLLPNRTDLGDWFAHARRTHVPLYGASDHNVSEAIYLEDPEGNGIEIYADRPFEVWHDADGRLIMPSRRLDLRGLPTGAGWSGAPAATRIGHVHLQTTDIAAAEAFWTARGFGLTSRYPGASFFGAGGYHHQLAANVWASAGRAPRRPDAPGLAALTFEGDAAARASFTAPSGVRVTFEPREI
ncbi:VOC family protein [Rhodobacterales bacterium HKCCE3408]|nr:VOC family protein [Rhodobacterales bacterium HKCCE3408]